MKFESKIGIGEICGYNENASRGGRLMDDVLVKVVAVTFAPGGDSGYTVEHIGPAFGVQRFVCQECQLNGDPDFDQAAGEYPDDLAPQQR
jgi:hypothetical protein